MGVAEKAARGAGSTSPTGRGMLWAATFLKDFVVVKDLVRHSVENPSELQKLTVNRVVGAVGGAESGWCCRMCGEGVVVEVVAVVCEVCAVGGAGEARCWGPWTRWRRRGGGGKEAAAGRACSGAATVRGGVDTAGRG